jgi:hypothetical protein
MDFVTGLSMLKSHNVILVVVDQLSKEHYYISYTAAEESITLEETAQMLYYNV